MSRRSPVRVLLAGAALSLSATAYTPPSEAGPPEPVHRNPPPPKPKPTPLPTWNEVGSGHPEGATNPPSPALIVTPSGQCYKDWEPGMLPPKGDRVEDCSKDEDCGTRIVCPEPKASELLDAWKAKQDAEK